VTVFAHSTIWKVEIAHYSHQQLIWTNLMEIRVVKLPKIAFHIAERYVTERTASQA
jgi:hypothetical protein